MDQMTFPEANIDTHNIPSINISEMLHQHKYVDAAKYDMFTKKAIF